MKHVSGLDNSLFKTLTSKKTAKNRAAIRRKLERIKQKLRSGGRLTAAEKEFLRRYAPGLYQEAVAAERERAAYEERLKRCRTKEEAERVKLEKMREMAARKEEDIETKEIRMAQTKAAEAAAAPALRRKPSQIEKEKKQREAENKRRRERAEKDRERLNRKRWEDQYYEEKKMKEKREEYFREKELGIYKRPGYRTDSLDETEYQPAPGRIEPTDHRAEFARGRAAYKAAVQSSPEDADGNGSGMTGYDPGRAKT